MGATHTAPTDQPSGARSRRPSGFGDELTVRPFIILILSALGILQLVLDPPTRFAGPLWALTVVVVALAVASAFPWTRLPAAARVGLAVVFAALAGALFPLPPATAASSLAFLASVTAGEKLASRHAALTVAGVGTAAATGVTFLLAGLGTASGQSPWWLALTVGIPVYIGIARRDRAAALAAAELAARQSERAAASEAHEAALEERGRIAREIHDVLGHSLSGIAMQLDMADALHGNGRHDEANEAVRRARTLAVSGIAETRRAIHALREDTLPLPETLARLAEGNATFEVTGEPAAVPVRTSQAVVRTAQEAITNARRHAPGGDIRVRLDYGDTVLRLTVTDTGPSRPAAGTTGQGSGMGLIGLRERAALLGGTLRAGPVPAPRTGWTVTLEVPR